MVYFPVQFSWKNYELVNFFDLSARYTGTCVNFVDNLCTVFFRVLDKVLGARSPARQD